ncbi:serine hydrolase [Rhodococcus coprophilus]
MPVLTALGPGVTGLGADAAADAAMLGSASLDAESLRMRIDAAAALAERRGAQMTIAVLDRSTGARTVGGVDQPIETASVVKLFVADDLLFRESTGEVTLSEDDYDLIEDMLRSSDDTAANLLWEQHGGSEIVERVAERHNLTGTTPPYSSWWWNTTTTASDLLTWYDDVLGGRGGLDAEASARIIGYLTDFTSNGSDGYDQTFGLPEGLPGVTGLGVKQGWMCCVSGEWVHLSTGFFGDDHRFVVAVTSREEVTYEEDDPMFGMGILPDLALYDVTSDGSARHARETVSLAVETALGTSTDR